MAIDQQISIEGVENIRHSKTKLSGVSSQPLTNTDYCHPNGDGIKATTSDSQRGKNLDDRASRHRQIQKIGEMLGNRPDRPHLIESRFFENAKFLRDIISSRLKKGDLTRGAINKIAKDYYEFSHRTHVNLHDKMRWWNEGGPNIKVIYIEYVERAISIIQGA